MTRWVDQQSKMIRESSRIGNDGLGAIVIAVDRIHKSCDIKSDNRCSVVVVERWIQRQAGHPGHVGGGGRHNKRRSERGGLGGERVVLPCRRADVTLDGLRCLNDSRFAGWLGF